MKGLIEEWESIRYQKQNDTMQKMRLSAKQEKAATKLELAFKQCQTLGVYLFAWGGHLMCVNGRHIERVSVGDGDEPNTTQLDTSMLYQVGDLHGQLSDDCLIVEHKESKQ